MRSPRRSTLRAAAATVGAVAVLALPAGTAFADSPAVPTPQVSTGDEQRPQVDPTPTPGPRDDKKRDEKKQDEKRDESKEKGKEKGKELARTYVTTVKLADKSVAKVYSFADGHFEADIVSDGTVFGTLVSTNGKPAHGEHNGLHVVLQPNGTVSSWVEGGTKPAEKPKPQVKKETSVRITMPDGRIAKLIDGPSGKRVELSMPNGNALGTLDAKNPNAVNDGWSYRLVTDGKITKFVVIDGKNGGASWVYDFSGKLIEKYTPEGSGKKAEKKSDKKAEKPATKPTGDRVVPKGGVKAGAEGVSTAEAQDSGETAVLLASGAGMAAVGAAGLGFALLRRRDAER
ncbi:hypothetical protein ACN20G_13035 [Streptomyces sp. BI20]|uniref:hypothetical protein n=1 Tax=Streptomyces sp. BI20 TaxID=3403460 RepID=UPI003C7747EC